MDWSLAHGLKVAFDFIFQRTRQGNLLNGEPYCFLKTDVLFSVFRLNKYCAKKRFAPFINILRPFSLPLSTHCSVWPHRPETTNIMDGEAGHPSVCSCFFPCVLCVYDNLSVTNSMAHPLTMYRTSFCSNQNTQTPSV